MAACIQARNVAGMLYPLGTTPQKAAYTAAAVLFVSLFVINCLNLCGVNIPYIGWISLGLTAGSFAALLLGGMWKHGISTPVGEDAGCSCFRLNKIHIGRFREVMHTIPLLIFCLAGAFGGIPLDTMAKGIIATQIISAGLYYGVVPCIINRAFKYAEAQAGLTKEDAEKNKKAIADVLGAPPPPPPQTDGEGRPIATDFPYEAIRDKPDGPPLVSPVAGDGAPNPDPVLDI